MSALRDHLMASVRQLVLDHLPYDRSDPDVVAALTSMSPSGLVARWLNWTWRIPPSVPREVLKSRELSSNPLLSHHLTDIEALTGAIARGADLEKYLSKAVRHGYVNPTGMALHRRQDLDLMLNAWGVHHLHLSQEMRDDGFVRRGGIIIFAVFRKDRAYLVDLMSHGDWAREHVIRVLVGNWPDDGLVDEVRGVVGVSRSRTEEEALTLRKAGVNSFLEIDGKVYMPRGGMSLAGIGIDAIRQADNIVITLEEFADQYDRDPGSITGLVSDVPFPSNPDFAASFGPEGYGVTEMKSGVFFRLGP
jgi:hypothetical protein